MTHLTCVSANCHLASKSISSSFIHSLIGQLKTTNQPSAVINYSERIQVPLEETSVPTAMLVGIFSLAVEHFVPGIVYESHAFSPTIALTTPAV